MTYIPEETKVIYQSKDGKEEKIFDALEWLAAMCSHPPALPDMLPMSMELRSDGDKLVLALNTGTALAGRCSRTKANKWCVTMASTAT